MEIGPFKHTAGPDRGTRLHLRGRMARRPVDSRRLEEEQADDGPATPEAQRTEDRLDIERRATTRPTRRGHPSRKALGLPGFQESCRPDSEDARSSHRLLLPLNAAGTVGIDTR